TCARTRDVEGSDGTVRSTQETVKHIVRVNVASRGRPCRVDGECGCALARAGPRARSIECDDVAISSTQERMTRIAAVNVVSQHLGAAFKSTPEPLRTFHTRHFT